MDPKVGRFTQQDDFQGFIKIPVTINKYLYADAEPVGKTDPSGHMSLPELTQGTNIQGGQRSAHVPVSRKALDTASRSRVIKIFTAFSVGPIPHWFVVSEGPFGNYRYDFGPQSLALGAIPLPGVLLMSTYQTLGFGERKQKIITRLNYMQWLAWSKTVLTTVNIDIGMPLNEGIAPVYCFIGSNCKTLRNKWVALAIAEAKVFERILK